jgi:transcription elongation factor GreA
VNKLKKDLKEIYLTSEGFLKLEEELDDLKKNKRPEIITAIKEARALGDLSENAEYSSARDNQAKIEARIKEIEFTLEHATIIENSNDGQVRVGSVVTIKYEEDDEEEEYTIVGTNEADPFENKISNESPIAVAVLGKKEGDTVSVESPNGNFDVVIVKVA